MLQIDALGECHTNITIICNKPEVCCSTCNFVSLPTLCINRSSRHIMAFMEWPAASVYSNRKKLHIPILLKGGLLLLIFLTFMIGTLRTFADIPTARANYQQEGILVQDLLKIGATRIYSEYWTCNRLTFRSREQIICSVLDDQLKPGFDRYLPYRAVVRAAYHPTYIFPLGSKPAAALQHKMQSSSTPYRVYVFDGYLVYQII